jgi:acetyl-CoA C-acetyltransferase
VADFKGRPYIMGHTAEIVAAHLGISREEMDAVALRSHNNVERATASGAFEEEIVPFEMARRKKPPLLFKQDEHFRPGLTLDDLASCCRPVFLPKGGKVTAGNSSGINDGAAALVIMSAQKAAELQLTPLARIAAVGRGACHPAIMGLSPVPAVTHLLDRGGYAIADFELCEINEAFAAQYIGCERELGLNREITNVNGSGIGIGPSCGSNGCAHYGLPDPCHAAPGQDPRFGHAVWWRGGLHGLRRGDDVAVLADCVQRLSPGQLTGLCHPRTKR